MAGVKNSLVKKEEQKTFSSFLMGDAVKKKINETVGGANGQRFITSILSAVSTNPALQECDHGSIISAAFLGEALKLSPSPQLGQYYMVPFNDNKRNCKVAQFQLGYKGYIQLAIRSGYYKNINVLTIKEGELIKYNPLTEELEVNLIEDDEIREQTPTIGYYAMFEYMNGFRKTLYWTKKKMLAHADKYSQAFSLNATTGKYPKVSYADFEAGKVPDNEMWKYSSFWYKDFDGMAHKTMLRQLISKWGIMSIDMQEAYTKDMATIKENGEYEYIESVEQPLDNVVEVQTENIETAQPVNKEEKKVEKPKQEVPQEQPKQEDIGQTPYGAEDTVNPVENESGEFNFFD